VAPGDWRFWGKQWVGAQGVPGEYLILIEGPSPDPDVTQRLEVIDLRTDLRHAIFYCHRPTESIAFIV